MDAVVPSRRQSCRCVGLDRCAGLGPAVVEPGCDTRQQRRGAQECRKSLWSGARIGAVGPCKRAHTPRCIRIKLLIVATRRRSSCTARHVPLGPTIARWSGSARVLSSGPSFGERQSDGPHSSVCRRVLAMVSIGAVLLTSNTLPMPPNGCRARDSRDSAYRDASGSPNRTVQSSRPTVSVPCRRRRSGWPQSY